MIQDGGTDAQRVPRAKPGSHRATFRSPEASGSETVFQRNQASPFSGKMALFWVDIWKSHSAFIAGNGKPVVRSHHLGLGIGEMAAASPGFP